MVENTNPLNKYYRQPAIYISLPSKGKYYTAESYQQTETGEIPVMPMTAKDEIAFICKLADQNDAIFANLEYRKAPETKTPGAAEDMVAAIKYFSTSPIKHNVDPQKIGISGSGAGANICLSALLILSKGKLQTNFVKAAYLWCPMINDSCL